MKTIQNLAVVAAMSLATLLAAGVSAQGAENNKQGVATPAKPATKDSDLTLGEIRRIDKANKKLTIKHGDIKNLQMPGMTMVFQLSDAGALDQLKVGDEVRFRAEMGPTGLLITEIHLSGR